MKRRLTIVSIAAIVVIGGIGLTRAAWSGHPTSSADDIPVAVVRRQELDLKVYSNGELRSPNAVAMSAPPIAGGALQITHLLHTGTPVKKGDVVIEFDPSEQRYKLDQSNSELQEAEQEIIKAKADARVQAAQDKVALLKARYGVRQAELEVQKNELVSTIDAKKNQLALEQAKRALDQLQQDIKSHGTTGQAGIELAQEKWQKAKLAMDLAKQNIAKMRVTSPISGLVALEKNMNAMGGIIFSGASLPDFHEGDQAQPGSTIAHIIISRELELSAKVSEVQRASIAVGQAAETEFDALPGKIFRSTIKTAAGMVQHQMWDPQSGSNFDVSLQLDDTDSRLRPGMTAQVLILGSKKSNPLCVSRLAIFEKDGKQMAYLKKSSGFEQVEIKVGAENESRAEILAGLREDDKVALVDPTLPRKASSPGSVASFGGNP
jgi:HlyD family secretion protein